MKKVLFVSLALALASLSVLSVARAAVIAENFSANPLQNGWRIFGNTNLFQWDSTNHNLAVTWDSSQTNSYFYHPLGTILTANDDFSLAFDLRLNDAEAGGYGFELAIGFLNLAEATSTNFNRSTGDNSPDLVEFTYFPVTTYSDSTVWPVFVDTNSSFNWNGASDYAIYAPTFGDWYHIMMTYTVSNQTMVTTITNFEQTSGVTIIDPLDLTNANYPFTDFRVDTISINSYQDDGFGDSIFAQGTVANFVVTIPPLPIQNLIGAFSNGVWQVQFISQSNWLYTLERTVDFISWSDVSTSIGGNGTNLFLQDTNPLTDRAFYRVRADRP
ncbi:MAG: hypothetical protein ABSG80_00905 [Verrucomicrobiota bacterium]|jgi:hypothetical protein